MTRCERRLHSTFNLNGIQTYYDYEKGTVREEVFIFTNSEEYEEYLVYEEKFEPLQIHMSDVGFENMDQTKDYLINIQMGIDHYDFFSDMATPVILENITKYYTTSQALDLIKEAYYPDMQKILFEYDDEIFENREKLLGYEQPRYYYADEHGNVLYYDYMDWWNGEVGHNVYCQGENLQYILTDSESEDVEIAIRESFS